MAEETKIQWCHHTFNGWRGCTKRGPECEHCYAETMSGRNPAVLGVWGKHGTRLIAESYGGDEATEINARTGCVGCNLASKDLALETILKIYPDKWGYLSPLLRLRPIYAEMKKPENRLRKWGEKLADGSLAANQGRLGPLTFKARKHFLKQIIAIEDDINDVAVRDRIAGKETPFVSLINNDEVRRIRELIDAETWPNGWTGDEMLGDQMTDKIFRDGTIQPWLLGD